MRNSRSDWRANESLPFGGRDIEGHSRPWRDPLVATLCECSNSQRCGLLVHNVVSTIHAEFLNVGVIAHLIAPEDIGTESQICGLARLR